ncbi:hypothetical protein SCACP_10130 [Sporomusa carbonis]|uniref:hypothetical protein n=1 Tax=Sporomusa carbonis TaxID=3076075 RepID=UPI003A792462
MKKWMIFCIGFAVIFIGGYMAYNNQDGKAREVRIVAEYQAIKHPEGAKTVYYELNRKFIKRWISSKYTYPISSDEVKRYYDIELASKGWQQIQYNSRPDYIFYAYAKDNLELVFGLNEKNSWTLTIYYVDAKY